jgi:hypothetical protein
MSALSALRPIGCALGVVLATSAAGGQNLHYIEPGVAACATPPAVSAAAMKAVRTGVAVPGRLHVSCGFEQGSYTVVLASSDAQASISPKTLLVNFGRVVGRGEFSVRFSTPGTQQLTATITSNMGSPIVPGRFVSVPSSLEVAAP